MDESYSPPNLFASSGNSDLFSGQTREFSTQLTSINLGDIVISSELFGQTLRLPGSLTGLVSLSFTLNYIPVTPSGHWLFERHPMTEVKETEGPGDLSEYIEEDVLPPREDWMWNPFRAKANEELMTEFYLAAGRAIAEMPCLRNMF